MSRAGDGIRGCAPGTGRAPGAAPRAPGSSAPWPASASRSGPHTLPSTNGTHSPLPCSPIARPPTRALHPRFLPDSGYVVSVARRLRARRCGGVDWGWGRRSSCVSDSGRSSGPRGFATSQRTRSTLPRLGSAHSTRRRRPSPAGKAGTPTGEAGRGEGKRGASWIRGEGAAGEGCGPPWGRTRGSVRCGRRPGSASRSCALFRGPRGTRPIASPAHCLPGPSFLALEGPSLNLPSVASSSVRSSRSFPKSCQVPGPWGLGAPLDSACGSELGMHAGRESRRSTPGSCKG